MNHRKRAFRRKVIYIAAIGLLLFPLGWLGSPAEVAEDGRSAGGTLATLRDEEGLAQASLGDVDPASETMKLATLGLRGVAANILWTKANEYKKKKNWNQLSVTLQQIIKIQPNFMSVWEYQAHNLSYNVSAEFDDYEYRYHWVKKGLYFLMEGIAFNRRDHRILSNLGRFFGLKLGRSDERIQFRRIFRKDRDFHNDLNSHIELANAQGPEGPDNWLVAERWHDKAERMVEENPEVVIRGRSPLMFYNDGPAQLRNYAEDLMSEYRPSERARRAWQDALEAWRDFGNREVRTSIGTTLVLNDGERILQRLDELKEELDELVPGVREELRQERYNELTPQELSAMNRSELSEEELAAIDADDSVPPIRKRMEKRKREQVKMFEMTFEDQAIAARARAKLEVSDKEVYDKVKEVAPENAEAAYRKFLEIADYSSRFQWVQNYRSQVHYGYWEVRCLAEAENRTVEARAALWDALDLERKTRLDSYVDIDPETGEPYTDEQGNPIVFDGAKQKYEKAFEMWAEVYEDYPDLIDQGESDTMIAAIMRYYEVLKEIGEDWPLDFALQYMVDRTAEGTEIDLPTSDDVKIMRERQVQLNEDPNKEEDKDDSTNDDADNADQQDGDGQQSDNDSGDASQTDTDTQDNAGSSSDGSDGDNDDQ